MTSAVQKFLPIRAELRLPTVDLAGARAILGLHENEIKLLVDDLAIPAWDIATKDGRKVRRELRLLALAARDYADGRHHDYPDAEITRRIYGTGLAGAVERPYILGTEFFAAWNCDSGHVINLLRDGSLKPLKSTDWSRGRNGTPCIDWSSAIAFLKTRRIGQ